MYDSAFNRWAQERERVPLENLIVLCPGLQGSTPSLVPISRLDGTYAVDIEHYGSRYGRATVASDGHGSRFVTFERLQTDGSRPRLRLDQAHGTWYLRGSLPILNSPGQAKAVSMALHSEVDGVLVWRGATHAFIPQPLSAPSMQTPTMSTLTWRWTRVEVPLPRGPLPWLTAACRHAVERGSQAASALLRLRACDRGRGVAGTDALGPYEALLGQLGSDYDAHLRTLCALGARAGSDDAWLEFAATVTSLLFRPTSAAALAAALGRAAPSLPPDDPWPALPSSILDCYGACECGSGEPLICLRCGRHVCLQRCAPEHARTCGGGQACFFSATWDLVLAVAGHNAAVWPGLYFGDTIDTMRPDTRRAAQLERCVKDGRLAQEIAKAASYGDQGYVFPWPYAAAPQVMQSLGMYGFWARGGYLGGMMVQAVGADMLQAAGADGFG